MAIASGLGSQLGFAAESSYGTAVTVDHFVPLDKQSIQYKPSIQQGMGFQNQFLALGARRLVTTSEATGSLDSQIFNQGMGLLLRTLMGTTLTAPTTVTTGVYTQTYTLADPIGQSLTIQAGIPDTSGVIHPYTYAGAKISGAEFTYDVGKILSAVWSVDAQAVTEATVLAAASYVNTLRPYDGTDVAVTVDSYGSTTVTTPADGVTKVAVKIERPMRTNGYYFNASGLKAEPILNDFGKITGTISAEYVDKTLWADKFAAQTGFSLQLAATGLNLTGTYYDQFIITLPCCYLDGNTPTVGGGDVVNGDFPFTCLFDGTNLPSIKIQSGESSL